MKSALILLTLISSFNAFAESNFQAEVTSHKEHEGRIVITGSSEEKPSWFEKKEKLAAVEYSKKLDLKNCEFIAIKTDEGYDKVQDFFQGKIVFLECDIPTTTPQYIVDLVTSLKSTDHDVRLAAAEELHYKGLSYLIKDSNLITKMIEAQHDEDSLINYALEEAVKTYEEMNKH
jgi:hypothetical protein